MCTLPPVARGSFCGFPRPLDVTHGPITSCALMCRAVPAALRTLSASDLELAVSLKGSGFLVSFRMKRGEDVGRARGAPGCRAGAGGQPLRRAERRVSARVPRPSEAALPPPPQAWGLPSRVVSSSQPAPPPSRPRTLSRRRHRHLPWVPVARVRGTVPRRHPQQGHGRVFFILGSAAVCSLSSRHSSLWFM